MSQDTSRALAWIGAGAVLLAVSVYVTATSKHTIMYGGILVGLLWIGRGVLRFQQSRRS